MLGAGAHMVLWDLFPVPLGGESEGPLGPERTPEDGQGPEERAQQGQGCEKEAENGPGAPH